MYWDFVQGLSCENENVLEKVMEYTGNNSFKLPPSYSLPTLWEISTSVQTQILDIQVK